MTSAKAIIAHVEAVGGELVLDGERLRCRLPEHAMYLLEELRSHRAQVICALSERRNTPATPAGVRLVGWDLKQAPVALDACSVVTDTAVFARTTVEQLRVAISNPKRWMGWSIPELVGRLARVGALVMIEKCSESSKV